MSKIPMVHSGWNQSQPDIGDLLHEFALNYRPVLKDQRLEDIAAFKQALYHRLAAEAQMYHIGPDLKVEALPLSKLKAIMEVKEL